MALCVLYDSPSKQQAIWYADHMKYTHRFGILLSYVILTIIILTQLWSIRQPYTFALPAAATVSTNFPKAGVHTRLTGVADEAFIAEQLDLVAAMGTPWIVELFPWAYAQPRSAYGYDWGGFDMVIAHARQRGITVVARLDFVPAWARPVGSSDRLLLPSMYAAYADYVAAFAARYADQGVRHLVIWNEPNLRFEWGGRQPDPEAYAELLAVVYPRVKAVAPHSIIIAGALSPGDSLGDNAEVRLGDQEYTARFFAAGGGNHIDAWGVHAYGAQVAPTTAPDWHEVNFRRVELVIDAIAPYGNFPIYITESGWNDHGRWQMAVTPAQRIRWSESAYAIAEQWPQVHLMALWQFGTPAPSRTYQDGWNIVAGNRVPRAIYYELQRWLRTTTPQPASP